MWSIESPPNQPERNREKHGILVIADFGLMAFHRGQSRSLVPGAKLHGTPTYAPPEWQLNYQVSRSYDIWSLGCVYLEFITWLVVRQLLVDFQVCELELTLNAVRLVWATTVLVNAL